MRATALLLALLAGATASADGSSPATLRFSGSASLIASPQQSADRRYSIAAELKTGATQQTGRFVISARLFAADEGTQGVCGAVGDLIFADGFEN